MSAREVINTNKDAVVALIKCAISEGTESKAIKKTKTMKSSIHPTPESITKQAYWCRGDLTEKAFMKYVTLPNKLSQPSLYEAWGNEYNDHS